MNYSKIIIRPILSEKANKLSSIKRQYVFEVTKSSNKLQIKAAVEKKFDVKVDKVRTINFKGKLKNTSVKSNDRVLRTSGYRSNWKKAIVTLNEGEQIDIVGGEL
tara:strand:+ start:1336 stop:1650 length:315 start_codon:yes stop_codon:yes gene_type:complete